MRLRSMFVSATLFAVVAWGLGPELAGLVDYLRDPDTGGILGTNRYSYRERLGEAELARVRLASALFGALAGAWFGIVWNMLAVRPRYFNALDPDTYPPRHHDLADMTDPLNYDTWSDFDAPPRDRATTRQRPWPWRR